MLKQLTPRQQAILEFVKQYIREHGFAPALREIGDATSISSTSVVAYNLRVLEKNRLIVRGKRVSRAMSIPIGGSNYVPLMGIIAAGIPLTFTAQQAESDMIELPASIAVDTHGIFALHVRGHSMIDALVADDDIVFLKRQHSATNGQMVAATIQDVGVTLKRFYDDGAHFRLQPANTTMQPIIVAKGTLFIEGIVVGVLRRVR